MIKRAYKWKLKEPFSIRTETEDVEHEWCVVKDGMLTIKAGYAWNGCTPKFSVLDWFLIGTPDGIIDYRTGKQKAYYATLVHDCMYQYRIGTREQADWMFYCALKSCEFMLAGLYYWAVKTFGEEWE